jgi:hypothetical protein
MEIREIMGKEHAGNYAKVTGKLKLGLCFQPSIPNGECLGLLMHTAIKGNRFGVRAEEKQKFR